MPADATHTSSLHALAEEEASALAEVKKQFAGKRADLLVSLNATRRAATAAAHATAEGLPRLGLHTRLVSFPKSGRTWLICLLAQMLGNSSTPQGISDGVVKSQGIIYEHGEFMTTRGQHPYKAHPFELVQAKANYWFKHHVCINEAAWLPGADLSKPYADRTQPKVILLERDVRDVIVSSFYERLYRGRFWNYKLPSWERSNISAYLRSPHGGTFGTLLAFRKTTHAALTRLRSDCPTRATRFKLVTYEKLKACPLCEMRALCEFLLYNPSRRLAAAAAMCSEEGRIERAIHRCSFSSLQKEAANGTAKGKFGETVRGDPQSSKIRKGVVGGFTSELSETDRAWLHARIVEANMTKTLGIESD